MIFFKLKKVKMRPPCSSEAEVVVKDFSRGVWLINVIKKERKTHFHEISLALFYRMRHGEDITRQFNNLALVVSLKKRPFAK